MIQNPEEGQKLREKFLNHQGLISDTKNTKGYHSATHECPPFAIVNPDDEIIEEGQLGQKKKRYGRQYEWGFCDAFSDKVSDFNRLYKLIISKSHNLIFLDVLWCQLIETTDRVIMPSYIQRLKSLEDSQTNSRSNRTLMKVGGMLVVTLFSGAMFAFKSSKK